MPRLPDLGHLPITRVRVELEALAPWTPPPHLGDMMRRALVSGMYAVVPGRDRGRLLGGWFDDRSGPDRGRPYALRVTPPDHADAGARTRLDLTFSGLIPEPDVLLDGLRFLAKKGLSEARVPHRVARVYVEGDTGADVDPQGGDPFPDPAPLESLLRLPARKVSAATVRFVTPFTPPIWRDPERPESLAVGPALLFDVAVRRIRASQRASGIEVDHWWRAPEGWTEAADLRWIERSVQSRRKRNPDVLGGVQGEVRVRGQWNDLVPALAAAEVLQMGRATSRGHGVVEVRWEYAD